MSTTATVLSRKLANRAKSPLTNEEVELKRYDVYAEGEFNTRVRQLIVTLKKVQADLIGLSSCHVCGSILNEWKKAGLPRLTNSEANRHEIIRDADNITFDAGGFGWTVAVYLATLESYVVPGDSDN